MGGPAPARLTQSAVAVVLLAALLMPGLPAATRSGRKGTSTLSSAQREALVLSRFTFGARAGDLAAIHAEGVEHWLDRQLTPARISDSAFENRLAEFPALRMTQSERSRRYPEPSVVRQLAKKGIVPPADPEERAILLDQVEFYQLRREQQAQTGAVAPGMAGENRGARGEGVGNAPVPAMQTNAAMDAAAAGGKPAGSAPLKPTPPRPLEGSVKPMAKARVDELLHCAPLVRYHAILQLIPEDVLALRNSVRGREEALTKGMTPLQKETLRALAGTNGMLLAEVDGARLLRDVYSERQMEAVMTDFWLNHFNVYDRKNGSMPSLLPGYEAVIRQHALGRFEDLLIAVATSPAMMLYLDNAGSVGPDSPAALSGRKKMGDGTNENYARELMELHTLGVDGGYTQRDISEVAKVFTGWTLERPGDGGAFLYNDRRHEPGAKQVLGRTIESQGQQEGFEVLHMLATSPATAHFLSQKLAERFVSDAPPETLVKRMAKIFLASDGDIASVLRTLYRSPEFNNPASVHAKLKTPLEYVVSAARASGAEISDPAALVQSLARFGMPLYGAPVPTGYRWDTDTWLSTSALIDRMNFATALSANRIKGTRVNWPEPVAVSTPSSPPTVEQADERMLERLLLSAGASQQTRATVLDQTSRRVKSGAGTGVGSSGVAETAGPALQRLSPEPPVHASEQASGPPAAREAMSTMAGLLLGSPEFQRR